MKIYSRNELCPCGSGLKYKKCCLNKDVQESIERSRPVIKRSKDYIEGMIRAARLVKKTLDHLSPKIQAGISTRQIESWANDFFKAHGAVSATLGYYGYKGAICTSINEVICHGIPSDRVLEDGDIVNIDVSCVLNGYFGDSSRMFLIGEVSSKARHLTETTQKCLELGIAAVKPWGKLQDIGAAIQKHAHENGFSVVEKFVGHAIGKKFHEDYLQVPHFGIKGRGEMLLPGMFFTIEPMINEGVKDAVILADGWTAITADKKLSAQFEHTVMLTTEGVRVITDEEDSLPLLDTEDFGILAA